VVRDLVVNELFDLVEKCHFVRGSQGLRSTRDRRSRFHLIARGAVCFLSCLFLLDVSSTSKGTYPLRSFRLCWSSFLCSSRLFYLLTTPLDRHPLNIGGRSPRRSLHKRPKARSCYSAHAVLREELFKLFEQVWRIDKQLGHLLVHLTGQLDSPIELTSRISLVSLW
jgi:hypothetical protein